jgi:hypothetical protein
LLASLTFVAVNHLLVATVAALWAATPARAVPRMLLSVDAELGIQVAADSVLLCMAPLVLVVVEHGIAFAPCCRFQSPRRTSSSSGESCRPVGTGHALGRRVTASLWACGVR